VLEIRELRPERPEALVDLFTAVLPDFDASASAAGGAAKFLDDAAAFALGAYVDEAPAGLAWGLRMRSPTGRLTTYLHELHVGEAWRRRGVATALVTEAMTLARRNGSTRFWLSTGGHNHAAQALYDALGGDRKPLGDVNYWWTFDDDVEEE
jgi:ribosomal protein S18 acetylase RimI-like enzyme